MLRSLALILALLAGVNVSCAPAAPVPKAVKEADYFPLAVGNRWEYAGQGDLTVEVTDETTTKEGVVFALKYTSTPGAVANRWYRKDKDAVIMTQVEASETGLGRLKSPATFLKLPLTTGTEWKLVYDQERSPVNTVELKVGAEEEIEVRGKKYLALPASWTVATDKSTGSFWYADGVGMVRCEVNGKVVSELKSFTTAKPKAK